MRIPEHEYEITAVRSQGSGGQNVNKVSSAAQLRFDVNASSLPDAIKHRLLARRDRRVTGAGVVVIKSQRHRSLEMNRADAVARLEDLVRIAATPVRKRVPTRVSRSQKRKRVDEKRRRSDVKRLRGRVSD